VRTNRPDKGTLGGAESEVEERSIEGSSRIISSLTIMATFVTNLSSAVAYNIYTLEHKATDEITIQKPRSSPRVPIIFKADPELAIYALLNFTFLCRPFFLAEIYVIFTSFVRGGCLACQEIQSLIGGLGIDAMTVRV
jgi:hypothetical protein